MLFSGTFSGCAEKSDESNSAESENTESQTQTVSVALWGNQLLENYAPWLAEQYPDVDFEFYVVNNSIDYYKFRNKNDELPDIMTVRRFSLRDVEDLKGELLDLSDTKLANSFYQSYLRNYTYDDGTVNWLPVCAEIDDIIVNKTLFEENNIPLPTDWNSFVYACEEFEKLGIRGFVTDFAMDYTCMETLQGFAASHMTSTEGREWRQQYESGLTDELSEEVWMPAFERMVEFLKVTGVTEDNYELKSTDIMNDFADGKIAMYRGTGADLVSYGENYEKLMMPYPGDSEDESWYLTYPEFQIAASNSAEESEERKELILDIMTTMFTEEAFTKVSNGQNMVAYNKNVDLELIPELDNLTEYIEENRIYIRLASSEMFSVSKNVVQKMINGELATAEEAYAEFNKEMVENSTTVSDKSYHINTAYSGKFENDGGNKAASAVNNTIREGLGVDCMITPSTIVTGNIIEGDYSEQELNFITNLSGGFLLKFNLTGEELKNLVQYTLDIKETRDSVAGDNTLTVSGGFEMEISKTDTGYTVDKITINGEEPEEGKTYSTVLRVDYEPDIEKLEASGFTNYESLEQTMQQILKDKLAKGSDLCEPTDYITLK